MTMKIARRTGLLGLAVAGLVLAGVSPAQAVPEEGIASGSVGTIDATYNGAAVQVDPLAACDSQGSTDTSSQRFVKTGFVEFGPGTSTCEVDPGTGVAKAQVNGDLFRLDALRTAGGPRIRVTDYSATCETTKNGSSASWEVGGLSGISVPDEIPPNYLVTIPGKHAGDPPLANVTFNETLTPDPADGSMTVNIMHIELYPAGGPTHGEIVVGTVACSPF
jgi:hypothetical protein